MALARAKQLKINSAVNLVYGLCRLWFSTCRVKILQPEIHQRWVLGPRPYIGATWHRGAIFYCYYYGPQHRLVMFSQSEDEYLARFAEKCGMIPVRGSSTRGGRRALVQMIRHLRAGRGSCATVLDGPSVALVARRTCWSWPKTPASPSCPATGPPTGCSPWKRPGTRPWSPNPSAPSPSATASPCLSPRLLQEELEGYRRELEKRMNDVVREVDEESRYSTRW